ncbi:MAG: sigma-70 family RNA polymerase sigma factor, partial [Mariprofundaceae bacterium]|nr:sigma-70 family RNA polymerase sigma factor [Mariprofundaceae bacterium]
LDASEEGQLVLAALPSAEAGPEDTVLENNWQAHRMSVLRSAMGRLDGRDRIIIERRHLAEEPATLKDLSEEFGVSIERVRQLESRALKQLKELAK